MPGRQGVSLASQGRYMVGVIEIMPDLSHKYSECLCRLWPEGTIRRGMEVGPEGMLRAFPSVPLTPVDPVASIYPCQNRHVDLDWKVLHYSLQSKYATLLNRESSLVSQRHPLQSASIHCPSGFPCGSISIAVDGWTDSKRFLVLFCILINSCAISTKYAGCFQRRQAPFLFLIEAPNVPSPHLHSCYTCSFPD